MSLDRIKIDNTKVTFQMRGLPGIRAEDSEARCLS